MLCVYKLSILVKHVIDKCLSHTFGVNVVARVINISLITQVMLYQTLSAGIFLNTTPIFTLEFVLYVDRGLGLNISKYSNSLHV